MNIDKAEAWLSVPENRVRMARLCDSWNWIKSEAAKMGLVANELIKGAK